MSGTVFVPPQRKPLTPDTLTEGSLRSLGVSREDLKFLIAAGMDFDQIIRQGVPAAADQFQRGRRTLDARALNIIEEVRRRNSNLSREVTQLREQKTPASCKYIIRKLREEEGRRARGPEAAAMILEEPGSWRPSGENFSSDREADKYISRYLEYVRNSIPEISPGMNFTPDQKQEIYKLLKTMDITTSNHMKKLMSNWGVTESERRKCEERWAMVRDNERTQKMIRDAEDLQITLAENPSIATILRSELKTLGDAKKLTRKVVADTKAHAEKVVADASKRAAEIVAAADAKAAAADAKAAAADAKAAAAVKRAPQLRTVTYPPRGYSTRKNPKSIAARLANFFSRKHTGGSRKVRRSVKRKTRRRRLFRRTH